MERRLKHWASPEFRGRTHQTRPSAPFLPLLFRQDGKEGAAGGASETTATERAAASDVSFPLYSFLPFQTASETRGLGFRANLWQPLSLGCAEPAPLEGSLFRCGGASIPQSPSVTAPFTQGSLGAADIVINFLPGVISGRGAYLWVRRFSM